VISEEDADGYSYIFQALSFLGFFVAFTLLTYVFWGYGIGIKKAH